MNSQRCVRCGRRERYLGSWLCSECYVSPKRQHEQGDIEGRNLDYRAARAALLTEYGWCGGWSRQDLEGAS
jgi:hypothetical protein